MHTVKMRVAIGRVLFCGLGAGRNILLTPTFMVSSRAFFAGGEQDGTAILKRMRAMRFGFFARPAHMMRRALFQLKYAMCFI